MKKLIYSLLFLATTSQAATLRVIYLIDRATFLVGDDMTVACRSNQAMLNEVFQAAADATGNTFTPTVLTGSDGAPSNVLRFLSSGLKVAPEDTLLFFYCGHGVTTPLSGHTFAQSNGRLPRKSVREALQRHRTKLTLLLSDTCSSYGLRVPSSGLGFPRGTDPKTSADLLFGAQGFVDMTAASPGEYSVFDEVDGGFYSMQMARTFWEDQTFLDANHDGRVSWKEYFPVVRDRTNAYLQWYKSVHPITDASHLAKTQYPSVWSLPND